MKTKSFFPNSRLAAKHLLLLTFFLFAGNSIRAQCPDWNDCISLINSDGCTHTFLISIEGEGAFENDPDFDVIINWNFAITSGIGTITSASFLDINGYMAQQGVSLNVNSSSLNISYANINQLLDADKLTGDQIIVTVEGEPQTCFTMARSGINMVWNFGGVGTCPATGTCDPIEVCTDGEYVSGLITAFSAQLADCPETENLGIEGAEVSITGANGDCSTSSGNDGSYGCYLCDGGPYEICVETTCDEPCGVTDLDLVMMREIILGKVPWPKHINFIGDVNNSGWMSTLDLVLIQREILGLDSTQIENWCRFVPVEDYEHLPNTSNATPQNYTSIDNCITVTDPSVSTDFIRFMLGDLNGSCTDCIHGDEKGDVRFIADDDEKGKLKFSIPMNDKLYALTLHVGVEQSSDILSIESDLPNVMYNVKDGELYLIWIDETKENQGFEYDGRVPLITIQYSGDKPSISVGENLLLSERNGISHLIADTKLERRSIETSTLTIENLTTVNIKGGSKEVNIAVYDLFGRLVEHQFINMNQTNRVQLNTDIELGIYILKVYNEENDITQKVLWTKNP